MSLDLSQFQGAFFEECMENLDSMERGLLNIDSNNDNFETINTIFRGAHSIKGGAATFGFSEVTEFTHVMETFLDRMRNGRKIPNADDIDLLLQSVDWLRNMLKALQDDSPIDTGRTDQLKSDLKKSLEEGPRKPQSQVEQKVENQPSDDINEDEFETLLDQLHGKGKSPGDGNPGENDSDEISEDEFESLLNILNGQVENLARSIDLTAAEHPAAAAEPPRPAAKEKAPSKPESKVTPGASEGTSIRVAIDKIDAIVNMVGELVITQSMLSELGANFEMNRLDRLVDGLAQLERNTRELQESVMRIRMLPISFAFNRFPRLVRDLSHSLGKKVNLKLSGEQTELDKTVMEKIGDPLVHLVRNSIDHGIEDPQTRRAAGKPETGLIHLNAYHKGGSIVIEIRDDGAGLRRSKIIEKARINRLIGETETLSDEMIHDLIFQPGFSTADTVSDISGRGVGMDVVRRNIKDLGGSIEVKSEEGKGSLFTIRLPLTLAILDGQLVRVGQEVYIIPLISIVESLQVKKGNLSSITGAAELYKLREDYIPIIRLHEIFDCDADNTELNGGLLVVVEGDGQRAGVLVDELLGQQQVVIKSLETNFRRVEGLSGATILGDGTVAIIIDVSGLIQVSRSGPGDFNRRRHAEKLIKAA